MEYNKLSQDLKHHTFIWTKENHAATLAPKFCFQR